MPARRNGTAWDGAWYRRAFYDDGTPLGTAADDECRIDAIAQSWAVLSGAADPLRARAAMRSRERSLGPRGCRGCCCSSHRHSTDRRAIQATSRAICLAFARTARNIRTRRSGPPSRWRDWGTATGRRAYENAQSSVASANASRRRERTWSSRTSWRATCMPRGARRPRRMDLVHGFGELELSRRAGRNPRVREAR